MPNLPARPSREHLRKAAKRLARHRSLRLAAAQRALASDYGFPAWADLMRYVDAVRGETASPLFAAVRAGDVGAVRALLANGANPRLGDGRETPLHLAARHGPAALVEALLEGGALEWQPDRKGRTALEIAQRGRPQERAAIVALLDRSRIADPSFRAAVAAIHAGDAAALGRLIDAEPRLLRDRIREPEVYRRANRFQYFLDPKLFWFIANNPTRAERLPSNIAEVARVMIDRGVEQDDLDYALGLTMTSGSARHDGVQRALMSELIAAGARVTLQMIEGTAAYHELDALRALLEHGMPMTAPIAAALGDVEALRELLDAAGPEERQSAFALAVINKNVEAARLALEAGADANAFLPVHRHSTALHQAAANDDPAMIELLLAHGAQSDTLDTLWEGTPLGWAIYLNKPRARAALETP